MGLLTDRINNKLEKSNLINEHALNREPVPLINNLLCRLQDNGNVIGLIWQRGFWGPVLSSIVAEFLRFLTFP